MRVIVIAAVALLAAPATAAANHVQGATYAGVVTTGQNGTVALEVSPDGSTVEAEFQGLGNVAGTCTGVGFSTGPVTITDHSFSYTSPDGLVTASGGFGPSSVNGGAQVLTTPCTTGSQAWTIVGADAFFMGSFLGEDVYNPTGEDQTEQSSVKLSEKAVEQLAIGNDGQSSARYGVKGCKSTKGFKVTFKDDSGNVTPEVTSGDYVTDQLAPSHIASDVQELTLSIKVLNNATVGKTKTCKVTASSNTLKDVIKVKVKAKRG